MTDRFTLDYNKSSWHYKVIYLVFTNYHWYRPVPNNLCPYLRKLVLSILAYPFVIIWNKLPEKINDHTDLGRTLFIYFIIVHTVWVLIYVLSGGVYYERTWEDGNAITETVKQLDWYWGTVFYLASIGVSTIIGGSIAVVCDLLDKRKLKKRMTGQSTRNETARLVSDFIHSKHNKICPRINFIDDEKDKEKKD